MNKAIKKNMVLVASLSATGVATLVLLIFVVIFLLRWSEYRDRTEVARNKISDLVKKKPAPGPENEKRIKTDIALYEERGRGLVDNFKSPLRPALDAFLTELPPPLASGLSEEEIALYREDAGEEKQEEAGEGEPAKPVKIRKLKYEEVRKFFSDRFEKFCAAKEIPEERRYSMTTLNRFHSECVGLFRRGGWNKALEKFVDAAAPLTYEPVNQANSLPVLFAAFGAPRRVDENTNLLKRQVGEMIVKRILPEAEKNGLRLEEGALDFVGGSDREKDAPLAVRDYPAAFFQWDVFGDIASRLGSAKVASLRKVILRRTKSGEAASGGTSGLADAFERIGSYKLYHYTIVFTGSMDSVREAMRRFDRAWVDRRMYVVRGLALYAKENGAAAVMGQVVRDEKNANRRSEDEGEGRRRRFVRSRRRPAAEAADSQGQNLSEDEIRRRIAEREKELPPEQRTGYAEIIVGKDQECIAFLDIDYVILEQEK